MNEITEQSLQQLFPSTDGIPPEHRQVAPGHQRRSLIAGEMVEWTGTVKTVR